MKQRQLQWQQCHRGAVTINDTEYCRVRIVWLVDDAIYVTCTLRCRSTRLDSMFILEPIF